MFFMTPIKWWSQTLVSLGSRESFKRGGEKETLKTLKPHAWLNCSFAPHCHYLGRAVIYNNCWVPHRLESCSLWQRLLSAFGWNLQNLWSEFSRLVYKSAFLRATEVNTSLYDASLPFTTSPRRENKLKLPHGWICYLAPEIVRKMSPGNNESQLPFSTSADVYAFGWVLREHWAAGLMYLHAWFDSKEPLVTLWFYFPLSTIWYELQARDWPITNQPVEATIWQVGSGEGIKKVLAEISLGKEVSVSWTC